MSNLQSPSLSSPSSAVRTKVFPLSLSLYIYIYIYILRLRFFELWDKALQLRFLFWCVNIGEKGVSFLVWLMVIGAWDIESCERESETIALFPFFFLSFVSLFFFFSHLNSGIGNLVKKGKQNRIIVGKLYITHI